jgi:hypothetical protein
MDIFIIWNKYYSPLVGHVEKVEKVCLREEDAKEHTEYLMQAVDEDTGELYYWAKYKAE